MQKVEISELRVGDKVAYFPFEGCDEALVENGRVKEVPEESLTHARVVFHCAGEWENFMNYTSQLTPVERLRRGWWHGELSREAPEISTPDALEKEEGEENRQ